MRTAPSRVPTAMEGPRWAPPRGCIAGVRGGDSSPNVSTKRNGPAPVSDAEGVSSGPMTGAPAPVPGPLRMSPLVPLGPLPLVAASGPPWPPPAPGPLTLRPRGRWYTCTESPARPS
eukprot:3514557-Pyramimonas_sp.AAC.1